MHQSDTSETAPEPEGRGDGPPRRRHSKNGRPSAPLPYHGKQVPPTAEAVNGVVSKRITVGTESSIGPPASASLVGAEEFPGGARELEAGRKLIVPSGAELELALSQANTLEELIGFEKMVSVLKKAGEQFRVVREEAIRIASFDLITARKIGVILLQVMKHGGDRTSGHRDHLLAKLLEDLGESKVKRCKQIARIEESCFASYLQEMTVAHAVPTEAGVLRHASKVAKAAGQAPRKPRKARTPKWATGGEALLSPAMLDCVQRVLGDIDVCVGTVRAKAKLSVPATTLQEKQLRGAVLVAECLDPGSWIPKLTKLHGSSHISEVVVALPLHPEERWFRALFDGCWVCCLTATSPAVVLAHLGHHHAFGVACREIGVVLRAWA